EEALRQGVLDALALDTRIEATVQGQAGPPQAAQAGPSPASQVGPPATSQDGPPASPGGAVKQSPAQPQPDPHQQYAAQPPPESPQGVGDQQGRVRRRSDELDQGGPSGPANGSAPPQVRVRGRGSAVQQQTGSVPSDPQGAEPSMAEQLGADGRPGGDAGPD